LPLAIELAAGLADVASPAEILERLGPGKLDQLSHGPIDLPARHRTLRDAIAWSYEPLPAAEQALARQLAVFAGGCTVEAARAVVRLPSGAPLPEARHPLQAGLDALERKSLLRRVADTDLPARYAMLETVREFAAEQLRAAGGREEAAARRRHARYYLAMAERAGAGLLGPDTTAWLAQLEREYANLRAALDWAVRHRAAATGLRLATALFWFWQWHWRPSEGRAWLERLLACAPRRASVVWVRALTAAGALAHLELDYSAAGTLLEEALALARQTNARAESAMALSRLGYLALHREDEARATALLGQSLDLHRALGRPARWGIALTLAELGGLALRRSDLSHARALCDESLHLFRQTGNPWGIAHALHGVGQVALAARRYERASAAYEERLAMSRQLGNLADVAHSLEWLGTVARLQGDASRALTHFEEALAVRTEWNDSWGLSFCLQGLAHLAVDRHPALALRLASAAAAELEARGNPHVGREVARLEREFAGARRTLGSTAARAWQAGRALAPSALAAEALDTLRRDRTGAAGGTARGAAREANVGDGSASRPPIVSAPGPRAGSRAKRVPTLTPREQEVAALVAAGLTNREIARQLVITEGTAGSHVEHMLAKLGLRSRAQIAAWIVGRGLATTQAG
jgi:non-specific serine/threonine protein kinase